MKIGERVKVNGHIAVISRVAHAHHCCVVFSNGEAVWVGNDTVEPLGDRVRIIAAKSSYYGETGRIMRTDLRGHFPILVKLDKSGDCLNFAECELEYLR